MFLKGTLAYLYDKTVKTFPVTVQSQFHHIIFALSLQAVFPSAP
jgi:hypothetical protein